MSLRSNAALVAAGLSVGVGAMMLMSQSAVYQRPAFEYIPSPQRFVQIRVGTPYVVPAGRQFVLTALGAAENPYSSTSRVYLNVNGAREVTSTGDWSNDGLSLLAVPNGFTVESGATITLTTDGPPNVPGRAWGYLYP